MKAENLSSNGGYRLAVIPSDPIDDYIKAGYGSWLENYYNPSGFFKEVYCFSPLETVERHIFGLHIIPTQLFEFRAKILEYNIDVVRAYGGYWACDFATSNKVDGVPVVVSIHDTNPELLHNSIQKADYVLVVSEACKRLIIDSNYPIERIVELPNRVDFNTFKPVNNEKLRYDFEKQFPAKKRILHVGRRENQKNLDTLIRAIKLLGDDYILIAVGRGDSLPYINLANEIGVEKQCYFIDSVPNEQLPEYYSFCDCFCTPSRYEGFGIVFIEALACGAIVVTSDIAPMNEYILNGENGLLVRQYENPMALALSINTACTDDGLRSCLSGFARESVRKFERSLVDRQESKFYQKVIYKSKLGNVQPSNEISTQPIVMTMNQNYDKLQKKLAQSKTIIDLGSGNNPIAGATVAVDLFVNPEQRALGNGETINIEALRSKGIRFVNARIDGPLPFNDKEFDFAYSHHVFEHLEDPATACREMIRIAKSGAIITPSPFAELAFGRKYHHWLVTDRDGKIIFLSKRIEEDRPFGQHPKFEQNQGWYADSETNPFDILLNDGDWYKEEESLQFERLGKLLKNYWWSHSPVIETIFLWDDSFEFIVIKESN